MMECMPFVLIVVLLALLDDCTHLMSHGKGSL